MDATSTDRLAAGLSGERVSAGAGPGDDPPGPSGGPRRVRGPGPILPGRRLEVGLPPDPGPVRGGRHHAGGVPSRVSVDRHIPRQASILELAASDRPELL